MKSRKGDRDYNEDFIQMRACDDRVLFALADGLGGCGHGEIASGTAVNSAVSRFSWENGEPGFLERAFQGAQDAVLLKQKLNPETKLMSTTLVLLVLGDEKAQWGHIGDARLYLFRNGEILKQTRDHSVPQMLVQVGEIKPEEIRHHPDRSRLLRVIGHPWEEIPYEISEEQSVRSGDTWLLCSDGFWEYITEDEMCTALREASDMTDWLLRMENIVQEHGREYDMDNYSAICVQVR